MRHRLVTALLISSVSSIFIICSAPANAAKHLYLKAPPRTSHNWTGFYVGGHVGYGWNKFSSTNATIGARTYDGNGWLGGVQAGYNYEIDPVVIGVEGDFSFSDVGYSTTSSGVTSKVKNDYFATAAARLGYAFDRFLVYAKGGGAWTRDKDSVGGLTGTFYRTGWLFGAGVEYALADHWSVKAEYDYLGFPSISENFAHTTGPSQVSLRAQLVKFGFNYHF